METACHLFENVRQILNQADPTSKAGAAELLWEAYRSGKFAFTPDLAEPPLPIGEPGRPEKPQLVAPRDVEKRSLSTPRGRAALIHSLTHIEFNAINLALDAVYRFRNLPPEYYRDWIQVAGEEALHFRLLRDHLRSLGFDYGDFTAHNGLWEMAVKTAHDPLARMALVPRLLEARGLDVTPGIMARLKTAGDDQGVAILEIILRDEVGHVEIGNRWFHHFCNERNLEPMATFLSLLHQFGIPVPSGQINREHRLMAGFTAEELDSLNAKPRLQD
jgi:uncharacterized ferritin-like protein (DUF455 family)